MPSNLDDFVDKEFLHALHPDIPAIGHFVPHLPDGMAVIDSLVVQAITIARIFMRGLVPARSILDARLQLDPVFVVNSPAVVNAILVHVDAMGDPGGVVEILGARDVPVKPHVLGLDGVDI